jgi:aryl-alcohol dehydrogenase-like predicted oxidoreductase
MPRRIFQAGEELSILGFPGLMLAGMDRLLARRIVGEARDAGINYFDTAPAYGGGEAERMLGNAIAPFRAEVFLASKTMQRDAPGARKELEESLRGLRTDRLDLYQFHALSETQQVEQLLAPGGAAEAVYRAREEGKIRFVGCSAHTARAALMMLERSPLDSIAFPINFVCYSRGDFGAAVLRRAAERGVARLALKAMALTRRGRRRDTHPNCWYQPIDLLFRRTSPPSFRPLILRYFVCPWSWRKGMSPWTPRPVANSSNGDAAYVPSCPSVDASGNCKHNTTGCTDFTDAPQGIGEISGIRGCHEEPFSGRAAGGSLLS